MTREEIDNLFVDFDEMGFCPTTLCKDAEEYAIEWRNNMRKAISNHETDLLKDFVEWYNTNPEYEYCIFPSAIYKFLKENKDAKPKESI